MSFPFALPTTGSLSFSDTLDCPSHPTLLLTATTHRSVLRDALKKHKRLEGASAQAAHLPSVITAVSDYLPYSLALQQARTLGITVEAKEQSKPFSTEWRPTLSASSALGREAKRVPLHGLGAEVIFVLSTLGCSYSLVGRDALLTLHRERHASTLLSNEQRTTTITTAMKQALTAHSIHTYTASLAQKFLATASVNDATGSWPVDILPATQTALAELALATATLLPVQKDDPYPFLALVANNSKSNEWMVGQATTLPAVRTGLFIRLCVAAAEHAARALGLLRSASGQGRGVDEDLLKYAEGLQSSARARACRFLGVEAEGRGAVGEAIAWIRCAKSELGLSSSSSSADNPTDGSSSSRSGGGSKVFSKLKTQISERREDKRVAQGHSEWGIDGGKYEEGRLCTFLENKWTKMNETINLQLIPDPAPLKQKVPGGREYHSDLREYRPPTLSEATRRQMARPLTNEEQKRMQRGGGERGDRESSSDEDGEGHVRREEGAREPVGAFPGTAAEYGAGDGGGGEAAEGGGAGKSVYY